MYKSKQILLLLSVLVACAPGYCQNAGKQVRKTPVSGHAPVGIAKLKFTETASLLDAALNSINSINSLIKKDSYRNKISSFNNPVTADMGFSLEAEVHVAMKPILEKAKSFNVSKFSGIMSSIFYNPAKNQFPISLFNTTNLFNSLITLVGNVAVNDKRITREDVDSFILRISKYFVHYEKLKQANILFNVNIDKFNAKLLELQFDIREYVIDIVTGLHPDMPRINIKYKGLEELLLKYLGKEILDTSFEKGLVKARGNPIYYPGDGIKTAKEIVHGIQKLFNEYQKIYSENYNEIRSILLQAKGLGKGVDGRQVDQAVSDLDRLYSESKEADILNLRLYTLSERLVFLINTENVN